MKTLNFDPDALRAGDESLLEKIRKALQNDFVSWAYSKYKCPDNVAEDIFCEILWDYYFKIMEGAQNPIKNKLSTYIYAAGKHKIFDYFKSIKAFHNYQEYVAATQNPYCFNSAEKNFDSQASTRILNLCLSALTPNERGFMLFCLNNEETLSTDQLIAATGHKTKNAFLVKKAKCLNKMRAFAKAKLSHLFKNKK